MRKRVGKAIYVFLCSLMGMLLFAIFHRSVMVIYFILLNNNFDLYSFGFSENAMRALDFFTLLLALFFGGWYGTALGLHWYRLVYEGPFKPGLLHGVIPHHMRKNRPHVPEARVQQSAVKPAPAKIVHVQQHPQKRMDSINVFSQLEKMAPAGIMPWDFDDDEFTSAPVAPKKTVKRKPRATAAAKEKEAKPAKARKAAPRKRTAKAKTTTKVTEAEAV